MNIYIRRNNSIITGEHFSETLNNNQISNKNILSITASDLDVYLINLKDSVDRYNNFLKIYNSSDLFPINIIKIDAVDGRKLDNIKDLVSDKAFNELTDAERLGYRTKHYQITRGSVGCYLSHLNTYEKVVQSSKDYAIIFEDDVKFNTMNILQEVQENLTTIPSDWDILLLGCVCYVCHKYDNYYDASKFILLHGYIIKKTSAAKIIKLLKDNPIEKQIDSVYSDLILQGDLKVYCLKKQLAIQNNNYKTNIQMPIKNIKGINPFANN